jgi:hypothetical protein
VTVANQPSGQTCTVYQASGTVTNMNVTNVVVVCDSGIHCGSMSCAASNRTCCDPEGSPNCTSSFCGRLDLPCDDDSDCAAAGHPGDVCCANLNTSNTSVLLVVCQTTCNGGHNIILCDPNEPGACPAGKTCKTYSVLNGYYACQ